MKKPKKTRLNSTVNISLNGTKALESLGKRINKVRGLLLPPESLTAFCLKALEERVERVERDLKG